MNKRVRIPLAENLRFPGPGSSSRGQSGPKTRPSGVVDGKQVNIPVPTGMALMQAGTEKDTLSGNRMPVQPRRREQ